MAPNKAYYEATENKTGKQFVVEVENDVDGKPLCKYLGALGSTIKSTAAATYRDNTTYVFRKMTEAEFKQTLADQNMQLHFTNQQSGEKWLTESLQHTREFKSEVADQVVAEFSVDKPGYKKIRDQAIPQKGSRSFQPKGETGPFKNIKNKERLGAEPQNINLGLKGEKNVADFNKFVSKVTKVDPNSFVNRSKVLRWIRRNPVRTVSLFLGIAIDGTLITVSIIEDGGTFGKSTQIEIGKILGGLVGAAAATNIGALVGTALGTIIPGIGNVILGFVGSLIGSLVGDEMVECGRYLLGMAPVTSGPRASVLDKDA